MKVDIKGKGSLPEVQAAPLQQLKVRSGLRAGATASQNASTATQSAATTSTNAATTPQSGDCSLGIGYWRKEYNYWKNLAQSMGCA